MTPPPKPNMNHVIIGTTSVSKKAPPCREKRKVEPQNAAISSRVAASTQAHYPLEFDLDRSSYGLEDDCSQPVLTSPDVRDDSDDDHYHHILPITQGKYQLKAESRTQAAYDAALARKNQLAKHRNKLEPNVTLGAGCRGAGSKGASSNGELNDCQGMKGYPSVSTCLKNDRDNVRSTPHETIQLKAEPRTQSDYVAALAQKNRLALQRVALPSHVATGNQNPKGVTDFSLQRARITEKIQVLNGGTMNEHPADHQHVPGVREDEVLNSDNCSLPPCDDNAHDDASAASNNSATDTTRIQSPNSSDGSNDTTTVECIADETTMRQGDCAEDNAGLAVAIAVNEVGATNQLPEAVEINEAASPNLSTHKPRIENRDLVAIGSCLGFLVVTTVLAGVGTGYAIERAKHNRTVLVPSSYRPPLVPMSYPTLRADAPTMRDVEISAALAQVFATDDVAKTQGSPFHFAAKWIANDDPMRIASNDTALLTQRFTLALFWSQSTNNGKNPWLSCNPLFAEENLSSETNTTGAVTPSVPVNSNDTACLFQNFSGFADDGSIFYENATATRWLSGAHECDWVGVFCQSGIVGEISMYANNIGGPFPTVLLNHLPELQNLTLAFGSLTGTIPRDLGNATKLMIFAVQGNNLTGSLPGELANLPQLGQVNVGQNLLSGTIPSSIGNATGLTALFLYTNSFDGAIPTEIFNLTNLQFMQLQGNHFNGTISSRLGALSNLTDIWIFDNQNLTGPIPPEIGNLTALTSLRISGNSLTGTLPSSLGKLTNLTVLEVEMNYLNGSLPDQLYDLTSLDTFALFQNAFTGTISTKIEQLSNLLYFVIQDNFFTGTIPSELGKCSNLVTVWIQYNKFWSNTSIPSELCALEVNETYGLLYLNADCHPNASPRIPCQCCTSCCVQSAESCFIQNL